MLKLGLWDSYNESCKTKLDYTNMQFNNMDVFTRMYCSIAIKKIIRKSRKKNFTQFQKYMQYR